MEKLHFVNFLTQGVESHKNIEGKSARKVKFLDTLQLIVRVYHFIMQP